MTRRTPFAVAAFILLIGSLRMQSAAGGETYTNPVIGEIGPADPCVVFFKDRYHLYYVQLPGFRIHVQRMETPLKKAGKPIKLIWPTEPWEGIRGAVNRVEGRR